MKQKTVKNSQPGLHQKPASRLLSIAKKIAFLLCFFFMSELAQAQGNFYHKDDKGSIRIYYEGNVYGSYHFRVILDNREDDGANIKLLSSDASVLFNGFYKKKEVIQKIRIEEPDDNAFVLQIKRPGETKPVSFAVNFVASYVDDVLIKPLPAKF